MVLVSGAGFAAGAAVDGVSRPKSGMSGSAVFAWAARSTSAARDG
jgi:hypothetical protein